MGNTVYTFLFYLINFFLFSLFWLQSGKISLTKKELIPIVFAFQRK